MAVTVLQYMVLAFVGCINSMTTLPTSDRGKCTLGGETFEVGETWHPVLEPSGEDRCTTCRCDAPDQLSCDRLECPELHCENTVCIENSCCPICIKKNTSVILPETSSFSVPIKSYCRFQGREYYDGERFPGERLFTGKRNNDCVQCTCFGGHINCGRTCPDPGCENPETPEGSCCPVCSDDAILRSNVEEISESDDSSANNSPPLPEFGSDHPFRESFVEDYACTVDDETYYDGERWHPVVHPFGISLCVICTCKLGVIDCGRVHCPAEDDLPCMKPVNVRGRCCRECTEEAEDNADFPICLDGIDTHLFYAYQPEVVVREGTGHVVTYAIEDIALETVRISQWEINLGVIQKYLVEETPSVNFERTKATPERKLGRFALIGATTKRRYDKLLRREEKIERRCTDDCLNNILKLTKVLRLSEVRRSLNCSQSETIVTKRKRSV